MRKKGLSVFLILCLLLSVFSFSAGAADNTTQNAEMVWNVSQEGFDYVLTVDVEGVLSFKNSTDAPWYRQRNNITKLIVGNNVDEIGKNAFVCLEKLKYVTISNGVSILNWSAFGRSARNIGLFDIPASVTSIVDGSYPQNSYWPMQVAYRGTEEEFKDICGFDDDDYEGRSYEWIRNANTDFIYLPEDEDVYGTSGEIEWSIDDENDIISFTGSGAMRDYIDVTVIEFDDSSFMAPWYSWREDIKEVVFSEDIAYIGDYAFADFANLVEVDFGNIIEIGNCAFYDCSSLDNIVLPATLEMLASSSFAGTAYYDDFENNWTENLEMYMTAEDGDVFLVKVFTEVYDENDNLIIKPEYTVKAGTKAIASSCFYKYRGENQITKINLGDVEAIGDYAFAGNEYLSDIDLSKVKKIGRGAFEDCGSLCEIDVSSATEIGLDAFSYTGYYDDENNWEYGLLYANDWLLDADWDYEISLGKVVIKPGITKTALVGLPDAEEIVIAESDIPITIDFVPYSTESIYIPEGTYIEPEAFFACWNLTDIYYGGSESDWTYSFEDHDCEPTIHYNYSGIVSQYNCNDDDTIDVRAVSFSMETDEDDVVIAAGFSGEEYKTMDSQTNDNGIGLWDMKIDGTDVDAIKVMLWNNFDDIKPLCIAKEITVE